VAQINDWKTTGVIRRFGASVRHHALGYAVNAMLVFELPPDRIDAAGRYLAACPAVSHCYQRATAPAWPYNLYAMTHCRGEDEQRTLAADLTAEIAPLRHEVLLTAQEYKKTTARFFMETPG
jgi:siroheme decarboxylase